MSRKTIDREFKKAVWQQGFSLEHDIFKIFNDDGWSVLPNRYFFDTSSKRTREYDLLVYKSFPYKDFIFYLVLIIECKFNPGRIVFYVRSLEKDDYPIQYFIGDETAKIIPYEETIKALKELKQYKTVFFSTEQIFGYQFFERVHNKNTSGVKNKFGPKFAYRGRQEITEKLIFAALTAVIQATKYEQKIRSKEKGKKHLILYFPIIIFSQRLYRAFLADSKKSLVKGHIFRYRTGLASGAPAAPEEFCVHIFDKESVPKAIRLFNQLYQKLCLVVKKSIDKANNT